MTQLNPKNVQFLNLDKVPYHHWYESIKECLIAMECDQFIDHKFDYKPKSGLTKEQKIGINSSKNLIKSSLNSMDRETVINCETPLEMINKLEYKYRSSHTRNVFDLFRQNHKIKFKGDISKLFSEVKRNSLQLAEKNLKLPDSCIVAKIIDVLPNEYKDICNQVELLNIKDESSITSDVFESMLLRRERELKDNESESTGVTLVTAKNRKKSNLKCNFCGLNNHLEKDCYRKNPSKSKNQKRSFYRQSNQQAKKKHDKNNDDDDNNLDVATILVLAASLVATNSQSPKFLADTGASYHIVNDKSLLVNHRHAERMIRGLKHSTKINVIGDLKCEFFNGTMWSSGLITHVAYVPDQPFNLISVGQLCRKGAKINTNKDGMVISRFGKPIIVANWSKDYENLFDLQIRVKQNVIASAASSIDSMALWHERCAHFSTKMISKMMNNKLVDGVPSNIGNNISFCVSCKSGKMTGTSHLKSSIHQYLKPSLKLHLDIGGYTTRSIHGNMYYLVAVDEFTNYIKIAFMKNRQETLEKFRKIVNEIKLDTGNDVLSIRTDHGSEFLSKDFKSFINSRGILHELATVKTPQQNGRVERAIRNIVDHSISMLSSSNLPLSLWDESTNCSVYVINRMLNSRNEIPFEKYFGRRVDLSNLRIFGSLGYALIKNDRHKYSSKTKKVFMVGYHSSNTYRVYCPTNRRIEFACDVKFNEQAKCHISTNSSNIDNKNLNSINNDDQNSSFSSNESTDLNHHDQTVTNPNIVIVNGGSDIDSINNPTGGSDENVTDTDLDDNDSEHVETTNRRSVGRPLGSSNRRYEINPERIDSLRPRSNESEAVVAIAGSEPNTFDEAVSSIDSEKWKLAMQHEFNQLIKNKTWALVESPSNVRVISVKWVFTIKEDGRYRARLVARGFEQDDKSSYDCYAPVVCMEKNAEFTIMIIYVDDGIIASTNKKKPLEIFDKLSKRFEIRKVESSRFLGIEYERNYRNRTIYLKQEQYLLDKLKNFEMNESRHSDTPFACGTNPYDTESPTNEDYPYRQAVGALLYLSCKTRPDIAYTVSLLARFTNAPNEIHVKSIKRLFRYLNGTRSVGICLGGEVPKSIVGYADADLAGDKIGGKTTTGHIVYFGGPIIWKTHLQKCTIDNTCEAEYISASLCSKDMKYIRNQLVEIGIETDIPILNCDNRSTVYQIYGQSITPKLRHIAIKFHSIRNDVIDNNLIVKWIPTDQQVADVLTKSLPPAKFIPLPNTIR
ncbi:retrovirus-related pol polyprotein from transposon tnt 1-94 [Dermatophagoides farinae]|uniref:Retrovirus-related pol polyprotein from transposon tnt 1-94 n=1 Tax=Dermatophagoides farinae TaxID=6954 RepID=A0A9D4P5E7_DERFA|nr:retrovirus-related pol polyprotein from transposon tnt 1-94 [Dermatophagoides farinae]